MKPTTQKQASHRKVTIAIATGCLVIGLAPRIAQSLDVTEDLRVMGDGTSMVPGNIEISGDLKLYASHGLYTQGIWDPWGNNDSNSNILLGSGNWGQGSSILVGYYNSSYLGSLVIGSGNSALKFSAAFGTNNTVETNAFAVGTMNIARLNSAAIGDDATAYGYASTSFGKGTFALSYGSTAVGQYNAYNWSSQNLSAWTGTADDHAFVVGIGTASSASDRENAFEVLQNGDVIIPKRQGDILMGIYGND